MAKKRINNIQMGSSEEDIHTNQYPEEYVTNDNPYISYGAYAPNSYGTDNLSYNASNYMTEQQYSHTPSNYLPYYESEFRTNFYEDNKLNSQRQIDLKFIEGKTRRSVTFSKRKKGLMKKAFELSVLTGSEVLVLVSSEGGHVFSFGTEKLKRLITEHEDLIKRYLDESSVLNNDDRKDKNY